MSRRNHGEKVNPLTGRTRIPRYAAEKVVPIKRPDGDDHTCLIAPNMNTKSRTKNNQACELNFLYYAPKRRFEDDDVPRPFLTPGLAERPIDSSPYVSRKASFSARPRLNAIHRAKN